jgi:hypothetical protein
MGLLQHAGGALACVLMCPSIRRRWPTSCKLRAALVSSSTLPALGLQCTARHRGGGGCMPR